MVESRLQTVSIDIQANCVEVSKEVAILNIFCKHGDDTGVQFQHVFLFLAHFQSYTERMDVAFL